MKNLYQQLILATFFLFSSLCGESQISTKQSIEFKNAPVLFKENNRSLQQVIVKCTVDNSGTILVREGGKELLKADLKKGGNTFLITVPAVKNDKKLTFTTIINGDKSETSKFILTPPRKWE